MEDCGFPWMMMSNINQHHHNHHHHHQYQHQEFEDSFIFGSANNIFFNPTQAHFPKPDPIIHWDLIPTATTATYPDFDCLFSGISSGNSVTKETTDDGVIVSSQKRKINGSYYDDDNNHQPRSKRSRSDPTRPTSFDPTRPASSTINFRQQACSESDETDSEAIAQMKEMIYRAAAFRPVSFADDETAVEKPRRKNVRISNDPQTVAARQRRERISERIRVLQKLVPGGSKMDTASMLDEAANYLKFLRSQIKELEQYHTTSNAHSISQCSSNINNVTTTLGVPFPMAHFLLPHHQQLNLP